MSLHQASVCVAVEADLTMRNIEVLEEQSTSHNHHPHTALSKIEQLEVSKN